MTSTFAKWCRKSSTISRRKLIWRASILPADLARSHRHRFDGFPELHYRYSPSARHRYPRDRLSEACHARRGSRLYRGETRIEQAPREVWTRQPLDPHQSRLASTYQSMGSTASTSACILTSDSIFAIAVVGGDKRPDQRPSASARRRAAAFRGLCALQRVLGPRILFRSRRPVTIGARTRRRLWNWNRPKPNQIQGRLRAL